MTGQVSIIVGINAEAKLHLTLILHHLAVGKHLKRCFNDLTAGVFSILVMLCR